MKKHISIVAIALMALAVAFVGCKKDPKPTPIPVNPAAPTITIMQGVDEIGQPYLVDGAQIELGGNQYVHFKVTCGDTQGVTVKFQALLGNEVVKEDEKQAMNGFESSFIIRFERGGDYVLKLVATDSYGQSANASLNVKVNEFDDSIFIGSFTCPETDLEYTFVKTDGIEYEGSNTVATALVVTKVGNGTYKGVLTVGEATYELDGSLQGTFVVFNGCNVEVPIRNYGLATVTFENFGFSKSSNDVLNFKGYFKNEDGIPGTEIAKIKMGLLLARMNQE